jgi:hypothetical protein
MALLFVDFVFAELKAALACIKAPLAYTPAVASTIGAPPLIGVAVKFIVLFAGI